MIVIEEENGKEIRMVLDGYGDYFQPEKHAQYICNGIENHHLEQEKLKSNPTPHIEPEWRDKPAGHHEKGSGI